MLKNPDEKSQDFSVTRVAKLQLMGFFSYQGKRLWEFSHKRQWQARLSGAFFHMPLCIFENQKLFLVAKLQRFFWEKNGKSCFCCENATKDGRAFFPKSP
jgi:hypothetical protein